MVYREWWRGGLMRRCYIYNGKLNLRGGVERRVCHVRRDNLKGHRTFSPPSSFLYFCLLGPDYQTPFPLPPLSFSYFPSYRVPLILFKFSPLSVLPVHSFPSYHLLLSLHFIYYFQKSFSGLVYTFVPEITLKFSQNQTCTNRSPVI